MIEATAGRGRNVIDFFDYRQRPRSGTVRIAIGARNLCSHCGAWLAEGESEDECSSLDAGPAASRGGDLARKRRRP